MTLPTTTITRDPSGHESFAAGRLGETVWRAAIRNCCALLYDSRQSGQFGLEAWINPLAVSLSLCSPLTSSKENVGEQYFYACRYAGFDQRRNFAAGAARPLVYFTFLILLTNLSNR